MKFKLFNSYKNELIKNENFKLTKGSTFILFLFILFLFSIIWSGIETQERTVKSVSKEFGHQCIDLVRQSDEIEKYLNRNIDDDIYGEHYRYKKWDIADFRSHTRENSYQSDFGLNEKCKALSILYVKLIRSNEFKDKLILIDTLKRLQTKTSSKINRVKTQYGDMLLEKIADQPHSKSILNHSTNSVKEELDLLREQRSATDKHLAIAQDISTLEQFKVFEAYLEEHKRAIYHQYTKKTSHYQLEKMIAVYLFLVPLFLVSYFLYRRLRVKGWHVTSYLVLHISNVAGIYILFFLAERIYQLIPKVLFEKIIELLTHYDLKVLINLFVLILFSLVFGLIIKKIQNNAKKDSNLAYVKEERLKEYFITGGCLKCNSSIDLERRYCAYCGHENHTECKSCQKKIRNGSIYCSHCKEKQI